VLVQSRYLLLMWQYIQLPNNLKTFDNMPKSGGFHHCSEELRDEIGEFGLGPDGLLWSSPISTVL